MKLSNHLQDKERFIPWLIFLAAAIYYGALSSKVFTWAFVSGDSGDWLASSTWWMVPQPLGSPLFILLGHFLNLFPGDLVVKMTICLSALPSALTVTMVYLITRRITRSTKVGLIAALVTIGAVVLLTQSIVLEEYALTTLFLTVAVWYYIDGSKTLTALFLGLATAVHAIVLPLVAIWLLLDRRNVRAYVKPLAVYAAVGILPYTLILILMAFHAPPLLADYLSIKSVYTYLTGTSGAIIGNIAIVDFPMRVLTWVGVLIVSVGLAAVPMAIATKRPFGPLKLPLAIAAFFSVYYLTNIDPVAWTFLAMAIPSVAVMAGVGIAKLKTKYLKQAVAAGAAVLVIANGFMFNVGAITEASPEAQTFVAELDAIPDGSAVVCYAGRYSLALFYEMAQGRDLVPLINNKLDEGAYPDYGRWLEENYAITGNTTYSIIQDAIDDRRPVYLAGAGWDPEWDQEVVGYWEELLRCCELKGNGSIRELVGFSPRPRLERD